MGQHVAAQILFTTQTQPTSARGASQLLVTIRLPERPPRENDDLWV